jgi:hypothetical protein
MKMIFASDFYIVQVEGNDWKKATRFKLQESLWTKLGQPFWVDRSQLARTIEAGFVVEVMPAEVEASFGKRILLINLNDEAHFHVEEIGPAGAAPLTI